MILNGLVAHPGVADSQLWQCLEFKFTAAAAGTVWSLLAEQGSAGTKVRAVTGNGTVDLLTAAQAEALVKTSSGLVSTEASAIAADLVTLTTNVPAAADAARSIVAVVGGLTGLGRVLCAEVEWCGIGTGAANASTVLRVAGPAVVATSSTSVTLADGLVAYPSVGVVAIAFAIPDVLDIPAASAPVTLKLWIKP